MASFLCSLCLWEYFLQSACHLRSAMKTIQKYKVSQYDFLLYVMS